MRRPLPIFIPAALLAIGLLQMVGDLTDQRGLKAVGAALMISPAPKVFSSVDGLETFSIGISLHWKDQTGMQQALSLTPPVSSNLRGPYNRRNVYGAVLAYGPVLRQSNIGRAMFDAVLEYALGQDGTLLQELGIDPAQVEGPITIRWDPAHAPENMLLEFQVPKAAQEPSQ